MSSIRDCLLGAVFILDSSSLFLKTPILIPSASSRPSAPPPAGFPGM